MVSKKQKANRVAKPSNVLPEKQEQQEIPKMSPHTGSNRQIQSPNQGNLHIGLQHQHPGQNQIAGHGLSVPQHQGHPTNSNNIPAHNIQTQPYHNQPPPMAVPPNYIPGAGGNQMYQVVQGLPNLFYSNFAANVNVHGYTHSMQPPYLPPATAFVAQEQQNQIEQVNSK